MKPEVRWVLPRNYLTLELLNRLSHPQSLNEALADGIRRVAIADVRVFDRPFHPSDDVFGFIDARKNHFGRSIDRHLATQQHQARPTGKNWMGNVAGPRRKRPWSGGGAPSEKLNSLIESKSRLTAISTSILAIIAPRQK